MFRFALMVLLLSASPLWGQVNLLSARTYPVGNAPRTVAAADLNGDGKADLIFANSSDNTISVLLSNGNGTFQPAVAYAAGGSGPESVISADFNGDSKADVAVAPCQQQGAPTAICIFLGKGDGTFQSSVNYSTSNFANGLASGDFNGDGKIDLAVATTAGVDILLGNGDGSFAAPLSFPVNGYAQYFAVGDFNHDGKLDLAVSGGKTTATSLWILQGNGDGTFTAGSTYSFISGISGVATLDANLDGKLDLALTNSTPFGSMGPAASVMLGNGDATFSAPVTYGSSFEPVALTVADFNGDTKPDIAVTDEYTNVVKVLIGQGDGTFQAVADYVAGSGEGVAIADFNGDGAIDIATANQASNDTSILLGNGDGTLQGARSYYLGGIASGDSGASIALSDFDEDGKLDFVTGANGATIGLGVGDGTFGPVTILGTSITQGIAVADFNHDGDIDIAGGNSTLSSGSVSEAALLGKGDGTFQPEMDSSVAAATAQYTATGTLVNGGHGDLAITQPNGGGSIMVGDGTGHFTLKSPVVHLTASYQAVVADFNGDGNEDVLQPEGQNLEVSMGNGDGTFQSTVLPYTFNKVMNAAVADLNKDGIPDIVAADYGAKNVSVLLGNGDGTFKTPVSYALVGIDAQAVAVVDMNSDGTPDLIAAVGSAVEILIGNGDGTFQSPVVYGSPFGNATMAIVVGDLNGDGLPDVVVEQLYPTITASINVYLSQATATLTPTVVTLTSSSNPAAAGQTVQLSATVVPSSGSGTPTGTITFRSGSTNLGSAPLSAGAASINTSTLAIGTNSLIATYSGDSTFSSASSSGLNEVINSTPFNVAPTANSATVTAGQPATFSLTLTPGTATNQTVTLTCSNLPLNTACSISPNSVTLSGTSTGTATVTIQTSGSALASFSHTSGPDRPAIASLFGVKWPTIFGVALSLGMIGARKRRRIGFSLVIASLLFVGACGGGNSSIGAGNGATPPGTYTIVVTAQASTFTQTLGLKLTVN